MLERVGTLLKNAGSFQVIATASARGGLASLTSGTFHCHRLKQLDFSERNLVGGL